MARPAPESRKYEMMILVAPTVAEEGLPAVVERVSGYVGNYDGEVESYTYESPWGRRRLAYPIQNFRDAFYVLYYFLAPPSAIAEIERDLRLDDSVIRHLIVRYDPMTEGEAGPDEDTGDEPEPEDEDEGASEAEDVEEEEEEDGDDEEGGEEPEE